MFGIVKESSKSFYNVLECSRLFKNVTKCPITFVNVREYFEKNALKFSKLCYNVRKCSKIHQKRLDHQRDFLFRHVWEHFRNRKRKSGIFWSILKCSIVLLWWDFQLCGGFSLERYIHRRWWDACLSILWKSMRVDQGKAKMIET